MKRAIVLIIAAMLAWACNSPAGVPTQLTIQGRLSDSGASLNGSHTMQFRIYDAQTGGSLIWTETQSLTVESGLFAGILGQTDPLPVSLFTGQAFWLETTVDGTTLTPRRPLVSTTYSFRAQRADTATVALNGVMTGGQWETDGTNVWRASGNVGVGTSTPGQDIDTGTARLGISAPNTNFGPALTLRADQVGRGVRLTTNGFSASGYTGTQVGLDVNTGYANMQVYANGASQAGHLLLQPQGGNVGIGNTDFQARLFVDAPIGGVPNYGILRIGSADYTGQSNNVVLALAPGVVNFDANGVTGGRFKIDAAGNVGIGTASPVNKLHVAGGITAGSLVGGSFNTLGATLGNGSVYALLDDGHLEFHGTYGYAVGDEYIDFQSDYSPSVGGQGSLARITANRNPEDWDLGRGRLKFSVRTGLSLTDMVVVDHQGVSIPGNLNVVGTKCRVVQGTKYGDLYFNAVESDRANFTASGRSVLKNGKCHVDLPPRWLAGVTIDDEHPLDVVAVVFYGPHGNWYAIPGTTGFDIIDPDGGNSEFCWTAQARQKGYQDLDLDRPGPTAVREER